MIPWWFALIAFFAGEVVGILVSALLDAGSDKDSKYIK